MFWLLVKVTKWVARSWGWVVRQFLKRRRLPLMLWRPPTMAIKSTAHKKWLLPVLTEAGWVEGDANGADLFWELQKKLIPNSYGARCFNCLPQLMHLDDKAVLALLTRSFTRTKPLTTYVLYGEWDDLRIEEVRTRWANASCTDPRWWIVKDAHTSNGFSAALFDRHARELSKKDVAGGYCYVIQEYVHRPYLLRDRKFEMRQYVLVCGDGSAYTYHRALMRLSCVPYDANSDDRRAHITNKWVQTKWESSNELCTLEDIEQTSVHWPPYEQLLSSSIVPLVQDLVEAIQPLLAAGRQRAPESGSRGHFELFACDLVVTDEMEAKLMEVNINPAFGTFLESTCCELVRPMFADLLRLCVVSSSTNAPQAGGFRCVRQPDACRAVPLDAAPATANNVSKELQAHFTYITFKKSHRKRYEHKVGNRRALWLSKAGA